jgi:cysteine desulfurase
MPQPVYLDHAATTPVRREVFEVMEPFYGPRFGNPSSVHRWGREARAALDEARERVARCLGAHPDEVCFTSGGTEADNLAVLGPLRSQVEKGRRVILSTPIEHKAVLATVHHAARDGVTERMLTVTKSGVVDVTASEAAIDDSVAVCTVMWVNNEVGTIQPVSEIAERVKAHGGIMHTDAIQAFGKIDMDVSKLGIDLLSISGHKIGAPKGIGAMYIRRGTRLDPLFHGGTQDRGRRPGTENVAYAVAKWNGLDSSRFVTRSRKVCSLAFPTPWYMGAARRGRRTSSTSLFRAPTASRCSWRSISPGWRHRPARRVRAET